METQRDMAEQDGTVRKPIISPKKQPLAAPNKILVTGGTGLVGSHLLKILSAGNDRITALHRGPVPKELELQNITWVTCDILDVITLQQTLEGIDQVYHCAAIVSFDPAQQLEMFKINVEGTANVVNAALVAGVKKMVHVSSVAALGRIRQGETIDETVNWTEGTSNSNYGKSKYLAEMEVWRGIGEGLQAVMVNPSIILGAADWNKGSAGIFKSAYNEFPWYTSGASGFVDVMDVVKAMHQLMQSDIIAQRFILNGDNRSYFDIFSLAAKAFGKKGPHKKISRFIAALVWRAEAIKSLLTGSKPLLTKETTKTALTTISYNNKKLLTYLPHFRYTSIETTIDRVCKELLESQITGTPH